MSEIPKMGDEEFQYDGSRIFIWIADTCGLSVDLVSKRMVMVYLNLYIYVKYMFVVCTSNEHTIKAKISLLQVNTRAYFGPKSIE